MDGDCSYQEDQVGQVYARTKMVQGVRAIMYSWYFPKDGVKNRVGGHRHDWEEVVLFFNQRAKIIGAAASKHGDYRTGDVSEFESPRPTVSLFRAGPLFATSELEFPTDGVTPSEKQPPLIQWESMTPAARKALNNADWGKANCAFNNNNFAEKLQEAYDEVFG